MDGLGQTATGQTKTETKPEDKGQQPPPAPTQSPAELETLRKQLAELQKERDAFAAAEEERKLASLSEVEKLKKQLEKANTERQAADTRWQEGRKRSAVELELAKRGCVDVGLAYGALPPDSIELADDGTVSGVAKALDALVASKPFLFGQQQSSTTTGAGSTSASSGAGAKTIKSADLRRMSDADFAQLERDVRAGRVRLS